MIIQSPNFFIQAESLPIDTNMTNARVPIKTLPVIPNLLTFRRT